MTQNDNFDSGSFRVYSDKRETYRVEFSMTRKGVVDFKAVAVSGPDTDDSEEELIGRVETENGKLSSAEIRNGEAVTRCSVSERTVRYTDPPGTTVTLGKDTERVDGYYAWDDTAPFLLHFPLLTLAKNEQEDGVVSVLSIRARITSLFSASLVRSVEANGKSYGVWHGGFDVIPLEIIVDAQFRIQSIRILEGPVVACRVGSEFLLEIDEHSN